MRRIDPEFQARLDGGATTLCRCWRVVRRDGATYGFTDHDGDVVFEGLTFRAGTGLDASALEAGTGLSVDNGQALGALSAASVSEDDIRTGKFDRAEVRQWLVDWTRPDLRVLLFRGEFGEIRRSDGAFEVELRGLAETLNAPVGRTILRSCDRILGDAKCGVDATRPEFTVETGALAGCTGSLVLSERLPAFEDGWFQHGSLTWLTGANSGERASIKADRVVNGQRRIDLWSEPSWPVVAGDRFRLVAGCDKQAATCRAKFDNMLNFRGFPHIPGEDWVTAYPKDGANHDGRSLRRS